MEHEAAASEPGCKTNLFPVSAQTFMEEVKSRGPFIYSVLESAQAFLAQHPFQEPEESLTDGKGAAHADSVPTAHICRIGRLTGVNASVHR